ncbi:MAG: YlmC/YmxH family sporulation protein [Faecalimonas sp.]|nr:YlmC/YmxH family sporulation protein [Faecalimonas sp.]
MRLRELHEKEVINLCNCNRLGCVSDLVFDECNGCIQCIIVPAQGKCFGLFGHDSEFVIPFECIKKIGSDIILVDICEEKFLNSCKG